MARKIRKVREILESPTGSHENLKKNQCTYCKEVGHWKIDCPKLKTKKESKSDSKIVMVVSNDSNSSGYSLFVTLIVCCSKKSEWILDTGTTYHICFKRKWFASFKKLDGDLVTFGDGHTCQIEGTGIVRIKLFNGMIRELKDVRYILSWKRI